MSLARARAASSVGHLSASMIAAPRRTTRCHAPSRSVIAHSADVPDTGANASYRSHPSGASRITSPPSERLEVREVGD